MRRLGLVCAMLLTAGAGALTGCGGHGHGFRTPASPVTITSTALPATLSGEVVNHSLPFTGGSGGAYILEVIQGATPPGVATDSNTVSLVGRVLKDGVYDFTLKLTDTGSDPFSVSIKQFHWEIGVGSLVFATDAILPTTVFNQFTSYPLVVAGGIAPYSCDVVDQPLPTVDEPLPTGMVIPSPSCTIVGAPTGVKSGPGTPPFTYKVSVRATDSTLPIPKTVTKIFTITVLVPPVVILTTSVANGKCGVPYIDQIQITDGIPPFRHELVDGTVFGTAQRLYGFNPAIPLGPTNVVKGAANSAYALDAAPGPSYGNKFPEGLFIKDDTGAIGGTPRRAGSFTWNYHVFSKTLPTTLSQNAYKPFPFSMSDGNPPALVLSNAVLLPGNTFTVVSTGNNFLLDADANKSYAKQFTSSGGVPMDGFSDAPSDLERADLTTGATPLAFRETTGQVQYSAVVSGAVGSLATLSMEFTSGGLLHGLIGGAANTIGNVRTSTPVVLNVTARDLQLPTTLLTGHSAGGFCRFSVGPDVVIITESIAAHSAIAVDANFAPLGSFNDKSFEYNDQSVFVYEPFASGQGVRPMVAGDLTQSHLALTDSVTPDTMLRNVDLQAICVNPTWRAYDPYNLNPKSARGLQHADPQRMVNGEGYNADSYTTTTINIASQLPTLATFERNGDACVELPAAPTVGHDPNGLGVYNDGGQLRAFDGGTYLGFFIVRKDSRVYIPFAINKTTQGLEGFGDTVMTSDKTKDSVFRRLQITVSPDGRFAACTLKADVDNFALASTSSNVKIAIFSLTGEKVFTGSQTFRILSTGGNGNSTDGLYMYGDSMALTNRALYYVKGNNIATSQAPDVIFSGHFVYRVDNVTDTASNPDLLARSFAGGAGANTGNWTNDTSKPLSLAFHRWGPPGSNGLNSATTSTNTGWSPSNSASSSNFITTGNPSKSALNAYAYNYGNFAENSAAQNPFRVNENGDTIVIVAADGFNTATRADNTTGVAPGPVNFLMRQLYTDYFDGTNFKFRGISSRRRFAGPARTAGNRGGDDYNGLYGHYQGPATQLEISKDGTAVVACYSNSTVGWSTSGTTNISQGDSRENLSFYASSATAGDPWSSSTETPVTATTFTNNNWRFGGIAITANLTRTTGSFVFWAGTPLGGATSFGTITQGSMTSGTLYSYTVSPASLDSILASADGGTGIVTGITTNGVSTIPTSFSESGRGSIQGGSYWYSADQKFVYYESISPLTNGVTSSGTQTNAPNDATAGRIVGVNLDTVSINGKSPLRGFAVGNWPTDPTSRGFGVIGASTSNWNPGYMWSFGAFPWNRRIGTNISGGSSGTVYFATYQQNNTWASTSDGTTSFSGGGPTNNVTWSDGGQYSGELYAFNSNVGGNVVNVSNLGNGTGISRIITYIQPNVAGTKVAVQMTQSSTTSFSFRMSDREQVFAVTNVNFNTSGALTSTPSRITIEGSNGRAGPSMAWDATDTKLYYAFGTAAGNENTMSLKEASLNSAGTSLTGTRSLAAGGFGNLAGARYSVLNSGR